MNSTILKAIIFFEILIGALPFLYYWEFFVFAGIYRAILYNPLSYVVWSTLIILQINSYIKIKGLIKRLRGSIIGEEIANKNQNVTPTLWDRIGKKERYFLIIMLAVQFVICGFILYQAMSFPVNLIPLNLSSIMSWGPFIRLIFGVANGCSATLTFMMIKNHIW